jgi:acetylornithine deacetylase/succinyl-diaminopimelate desuccinylase-like protein
MHRELTHCLDAIHVGSDSHPHPAAQRGTLREDRAECGVHNSVDREAARRAALRDEWPEKAHEYRASAGYRRARPRLVGSSVRACLALVLLLSCGLVRRAAGGEPDWHRLGDETADLLSDVLRIDTSNPPGGETAAANALARKLRGEAIAAEVFESAPGRGNLHARLAGSGGGRPVILLAHLDVVPADPRSWRLPPFGGVKEHGWVHGRGALDAKGVAVVELMTLIALKRSGVPLDRDVILLGTADEETGGTAGAGWIVQHRPELLGNAEYLLTEGDHIHVRAGRKVVQVAIAEKTPCWVKLTAHGEGGHGSTPPPQTAVTRLVRALDKLRRYRTAVRVVPAVEDYFAALAELEKDPLRSRLARLEDALNDPGFFAEFTRNPRQNALIRNTITPTVLEGSLKTNVIPDEASAQLDCRLLPGERPADFLALLRDVIADDTIRVQPLLSFPASSSDPDSGLMAAVRKLAASELGGAPVVPSVITGFTDSHYFREKGVASYGFVPFVLREEDERTVHGVNERVSIENLRDGVRRLVALLRALPSDASRGAGAAPM